RNLIEWIKEFFNNNEKDLENILRLMEDHEENENWFSGLIGFYYEHGIGNKYGIIDKNNSLKFYLLSINNNNYYDNNENDNDDDDDNENDDDDKNKKLFSIYQLLNIIISKF